MYKKLKLNQKFLIGYVDKCWKDQFKYNPNHDFSLTFGYLCADIPRIVKKKPYWNNKKVCILIKEI